MDTVISCTQYKGPSTIDTSRSDKIFLQPTNLDCCEIIAYGKVFVRNSQYPKQTVCDANSLNLAIYLAPIYDYIYMYIYIYEGFLHCAHLSH